MDNNNLQLFEREFHPLWGACSCQGWRFCILLKNMQ